MRHADAELALWIANDRLARQRREAELAKLVRHGSETPSLRQRAGMAIIAVGERLAGTAGPMRNRGLAARAS